METIKRNNVAQSKYGAVMFTQSDGQLAPSGYGLYAYFPSEVLMLAMTYMYAGERDFGLDLAQRCWENMTCRWGYTWDQPNFFRSDQDTGERLYGHDYYQNMMFWSLPAALAGKPLNEPLKSGGLVDRIRKAAATE